MKIHICTPFSLNKNLGKAYNEAFGLIPDEDWLCVTDTDILFLTPDCGNILHEYASLYPTAGIMTCFTNRVSLASKEQLLTGRIDGNPSMAYHLQLAERQKRHLYKTSQINAPISGMLMLISKRTWLEHKFNEDAKCLGVDTIYSQSILDSGKTILRMDGLYVFHIYRIKQGIHHKKHLL